MSDRHPKWTPVEPGHVIPAGQPYRVEYPHAGPNEEVAIDWHPVTKTITVVQDGLRWFVDSSWKPPLVLPTEGTHGVVIWKAPGDKWFHADIGRWAHYSTDPRVLTRSHHSDAETQRNTIDLSVIVGFIPLTDEQAKQYEAMP